MIMAPTSDEAGCEGRVAPPRGASTASPPGGEFTMPPTEVMAGSVIATLKDGCGNLIQITQLAH